MTEKKKNRILIISSIIFSLILIEITLSIHFSIKKNKSLSSEEPGYLLYDQGRTFMNKEKIVKYHPNKKILTEAYYKINDDFKKAYSYEITTNNFGLVQKNDLKKNVPSILFLGDSFTEGQGATSWIDKFDGKFREYQIINGGILATGHQQFELMERHVSKKYDIEKVFLLFIGHDIRRSPFLIHKNQMDCLNDFKKCKGDEIFFGFPISSEDPKNFLNFISDQRIKNYENMPLKKKIKTKVRGFFSNLYVIKIPSDFLKEKFYKSKNIKIKKNFAAIKRLYEKYRENIFFIHVLTRNEILNGKTYESHFTEKFIQNFTDNLYFCDFNRNLDYFNSLDHHPNEDGYNHLFKCVDKIMKVKLD